MLTAHQIFFELQATEPIWLHAHNGSAMRGMVYGALREMSEGKWVETDLQFRPNDPVLQRLLATLDETSDRGQDVPRPYVIVPPILNEQQRQTHIVPPGESITFGVTLFGEAIEAFRFIVTAVKVGGRIGGCD